MKKTFLIPVLVLALTALACSASSLTSLIDNVASEVEQGGEGALLDQISSLLPQSEASESVVVGETLLQEDFSSDDAWEFYQDEQGARLQVTNGAYRMQLDSSGYIWGVNETVHSDVVITVDATHHSADEGNGYGVMCRADTTNNGDGYYFIVASDGFYSISLGTGDTVDPIVEWDTSSAIRRGAATNRIQAVCVGNYFALYVNDQFVAEVYDNTFSRGFAGFSVAVFGDTPVDASFDNLTISAATLE